MFLVHQERRIIRARVGLFGGLCWFALVAGCGPNDRTLLDALQSAIGGGNGHGNHHNPPPEVCQSQDADDLYAAVANDVSQLDADDAPFARYVSFANQANVEGCDFDAEASSATLSKFVNSLSINARITQPEPIDAALTLHRIDLRDFDWNRSVQVGGATASDVWEAFIASTPYAVPFVGDAADGAVAATGTSVPVLFGDVLIATGIQAPLYYSVLRIPADIDDFVADDLQIDLAAARANGATARAGFVDGSREFLAERFEIQVRSGVLWQISDVGCNRGRGCRPRTGTSLFDDPLANPTGERELVFTLPNGMQAHVLANGAGAVLDVSAVRLDETQSDGRAHVAQSFFRSRAQGIQLEDQVRPFALANPDNFSEAELEAILALYPDAEDLEALLDADRNFYAFALEDAGVDIDQSPEPLSDALAEFSGELDAASVAGALLISEEDLLNELSNLDPSLSVLGAGGSVSRADFDALYVQSLCIMSVVLENQPDIATCDAAL